MKIKISKSQWVGIGKKAGWRKVSEEIKGSQLYKKFLQEGKSPKDAAVEVLDTISNGLFVSVEEPKRTELINRVIQQYEKK
jgi:hypothetical protein